MSEKELRLTGIYNKVKIVSLLNQELQKYRTIKCISKVVLLDYGSEYICRAQCGKSAR